jgi:hypothetical protein
MLAFLKNPKYVLFIVLLVSTFSLLVSLPRMEIKRDFDFSNTKLGPFVEKWISKDKKISINQEIGGYHLNILNEIH